MSARVEYREIESKSAMNPVKGMPFRWSLNPYRGCVHGCHYCFARRYHTYLELDADDDFTGIVFVKTNVAERLREELWHPRWHRQTVAIGTATDPYQPIEGKYRLTRRCLEALAERRNAVGIVTKGPMVIRDVDVLAQMAKTSEATVCVTVTTLDKNLARRLEPTTAPPSQRLTAVERLSAAGVRAGVLAAPVVPGLTDTRQGMDELAKAAADSGAHFFGGRTLYLMPGTREHFMTFVDNEFPELSEMYGRAYRGAYASRAITNEIDALMSEVRERYGLSEREDSVDAQGPRQLQMAL